MVRRLQVAALFLALLLSAAAAPALATGGRPYTIHGTVLHPDGRPVANWPVRITPVRPNGDDDLSNVYYKLTNYDDHLTYTDAEGRFTMTDVIDLDQVETHKYRVWSGGSDLDEVRMRVNPCIQVSQFIDFHEIKEKEIYLVIRAEARSAVRVTMKFADGTPFNGTVSVAIQNGKRLQSRTAVFKDGLWGAPALPLGDGPNPGRILILKDKDNGETAARLLASGKELTPETVKEIGVLLDKRVRFLPYQVATAELILPVEAKEMFGQ